MKVAVTVDDMRRTWEARSRYCDWQRAPVFRFHILQDLAVEISDQPAAFDPHAIVDPAVMAVHLENERHPDGTVTYIAIGTMEKSRLQTELDRLRLDPRERRSRTRRERKVGQSN